MKKLILSSALLLCAVMNAQFTVLVEAPADFTGKDAILYTLNGSKNIILATEARTGNTWNFKVKQPYSGMMRLYFPDSNAAMNFISENRNVNFSLDTKGNKITDVVFRDEANQLMSRVQDLQSKNQDIFPALVQIKSYYNANTEFGKALDKEIARLGDAPSIDASKYPFVSYYVTNYEKYAVENSARKYPSKEEYINFLTKTGAELESSSLLQPVLVNYLTVAKEDLNAAIDQLLAAVNTGTPRGQTILSELIEIFDMYHMDAQKQKYLSLAKNLKCTINDRLAGTIKAQDNVKIGNTFPNYTFTNAKNTAAKSLADVKAQKKVVIFWSSTCSHCEAELPELLAEYSKIKAGGTEIIGFSVDTDRASYESRIKAFPWINESQLRGWNSTYVDIYNVKETPTYYILDAKNMILSNPDHAKDVLAELGIK